MLIACGLSGCAIFCWCRFFFLLQTLLAIFTTSYFQCTRRVRAVAGLQGCAALVMACWLDTTKGHVIRMTKKNLEKKNAVIPVFCFRGESSHVASRRIAWYRITLHHMCATGICCFLLVIHGKGKSLPSHRVRRASNTTSTTCLLLSIAWCSSSVKRRIVLHEP